MRYFFLCFLVLFGLSSCITQKDLVYFQDKGGDAKKSVEVSKKINESYRLQPHDMLSIQMRTIDPKINQLLEIISDDQMANLGINQFSEQGLYFHGYSLDNQGNIRIPVLGKLNVLGFTTDEVTELIETKLNEDYVTENAQLFVAVKMAGIRYVINGEVARPGINFIFNNKATIMDAIANSGDITIVGDRKAVMVYRQYPHGTETYAIDLTDKNAMNLPQFYLQPNDLIYVKPLKQKTLGFGTNGLQTISLAISALTLITTTYLFFSQ